MRTDGVAPHDPPTQRRASQVRCRSPVPEQLDELKHALHSPHITAPHASPSVSRVHIRVSSVELVTQAPPAQTGVRTERVWVPLSPHVPENPPHGPQSSRSTAPQDSPSVGRAHPAVSVSTTMILWQPPPMHTGVVTVRDREPMSLHAPA